MAQNLVKDAFWESLSRTFFRFGKLKKIKENLDFFLKKSQNFV
jgi:hypothetical protein